MRGIDTMRIMRINNAGKAYNRKNSSIFDPKFPRVVNIIAKVITDDPTAKLDLEVST